jgi:hypothetical protein
MSVHILIEHPVESPPEPRFVALPWPSTSVGVAVGPTSSPPSQLARFFFFSLSLDFFTTTTAAILDHSFKEKSTVIISRKSDHPGAISVWRVVKPNANGFGYLFWTRCHLPRGRRRCIWPFLARQCIAGFHSITKVKQRWARLVFGWVTNDDGCQQDRIHQIVIWDGIHQYFYNFSIFFLSFF